MMKDEPDDEPDDDDEPLDEVLPADDDTMVTMAWQAMAPDGKQWREVPLPTARQLLVVARNDYVTRHVPGEEDLPVDAYGEPSAEQLQDIANNDIATAIDWRNIAAMDVDDFNSDDDDEPLDEVLPADDDTMVTMAWQAMAPDGKQWREVPLPTARQLLVVARNDYVTRHVPGEEDLPVDAYGEPSAEQLQDIANNDIATAIDWRNIAAMDVDDFNSPMDDF